MALARLDKILSNNGFGSRKDVKKILHSGSVAVNGNVTGDAAFHVDTEKDTITIDGEVLELQQNIYLMMNKCADVVSANKDGEHQTVFDLLEDSYRVGKTASELHTVGRLDIDTEGLLILTTDGKLTHRLISPKNHISKTYLVFLAEAMSEQQKADCTAQFKAGIHIEAEGAESEADLESAEVVFYSAEEALKAAGNHGNLPLNAKDYALLTISEGKYHQVKRMFKAVGNEVVYLKRTAMGTLKLDSSIEPGSYRPLTQDEKELLLSF